MTTTTAKTNSQLDINDNGPQVGALAVPDTANQILTRVADAEARFDDLDDLDMVPGAAVSVPFIRTNGNIDGGLFIDGEQVESVRCVIAARSLSRSYFQKSWDEDKTARPVCWSVDGETPAEGVTDKQADKCRQCPMSYEHSTEKQKCRKNLELLAYVPDSSANDIAILRFRLGGISFGPAMRYWDSFRTRMPKSHPIGWITEVTMRPVETSNGRKLAAHFEREELLAPAHSELFITDARRRKAMWQQMIADDVTEAAAQTSDGSDNGGPFDGGPVDPETGEMAPKRSYVPITTPGDGLPF